MKLVLSLVAAVGMTTCLRAAEMPKGEFGFPLGTYLKIEGSRALKTQKDPRSPKVAYERAIMVDTVNGRKLERPIRLDVSNAVLNSDVRYVLRGFEGGATAGGFPDEVVREENKFCEKHGDAQQGWHFRVTFTVTSVVEPEGAELDTKNKQTDFIIGQRAQAGD